MSSPLWRRFEAIAERRGDAPAVLQGDRRVSFAELHQNAARLATEMLRRGVKPGDRCLIWAGNSPELAAALLATLGVGAIIALVNDEAPVAHLTHAAGITEPKLILVDEAGADATAKAATAPILMLGIPTTEISGCIPGGRVHEGEPASILFTSGSTGPPKGVTQSHANLAAGARMVAEHLRLTRDDRLLCPIPWAFDYGYGQFLSMALLGLTQVLPTARNSFALCEAISSHRPTVFAGLPSIFGLLLRGVSPLRRTDLSSLRLVMNTGGAIPPSIFTDLVTVFGHCDISLNYGLTETYRSAGLPVELARERPESVGFAYPGVSLNVLRDTGEEAEPDELGEIVHRGPGVFLGYWGAAEATAKVRRPDPFWPRPDLAPSMAVFTGDLGWKDKDGFLMIKGRRDRLIKTMGVRVSPDEVETLIRRSGLVRDAAVLGVPSELMGEKVVAALVLNEEGPDPVPALKALARREMSQHMQPREYRVFESFPLTPNGKTDFAELRALFESGRS